MKRGTPLAAAGVVAAALGAVVAFGPIRDDKPPRGAVVQATSGGSAPDLARGEAVFRTCSACHTVGRGGADVDGPNLYGVVGAKVAERRPRYGYTQALRDARGTWTEARLQAWLADPAAFAPGTAMHFPGLPDAGDRRDVVAYLATQGPVRR